MVGTAIMAMALANGDGRPPGWQIFIGIVFLLMLNTVLTVLGYLIIEDNAGNAVAALSPKTKVFFINSLHSSLCFIVLILDISRFDCLFAFIFCVY